LPWADSKSDWDQFARLLAPAPSEKILDVGAGKCAVAARVLELSHDVEVYAVDPSEKRIARAMKVFPKVKASVAGAEKLPFPESYFDKVYTTMAVHHFADLDLALGEMARVLKKEGVFVALDVEPGSGLGMLFRSLGRLFGESMRMRTKEQFTVKLASNGAFEVLQSARLGSRYLVQARRTR
jgi:ubiquinone/menaquinone biosynthesis C-methylase UbiE